MKRVISVLVLRAVALVLLCGLAGCAQLGGPLEPVENDKSGLYFKNRLGVYVLYPRDCGFLGCIGPDLRPFKHGPMRFADPATFQILFQGDDSYTILARDREHVFWGGEYVPTGDVSTLRLFDGYATDKNNLYFNGAISGVDTAQLRHVGGPFFSDTGGLFLARSSPPTRMEFADPDTFGFYASPVRSNGRYYEAEDKNFRYYRDPDYRVDAKPGVEGFEKLGCGYYRFQGQIFYGLQRLGATDAATFRVLGAHDGASGRDVERCDLPYYAVDKNRRYQFDDEVRPEDERRNHEIEMLLAPPGDRKALSKNRTVYNCKPGRTAANSDYGAVYDKSVKPGSVRFESYADAGLTESSIVDAAGHWQPLPAVWKAGASLGCESLRVERFAGADPKPWFSRRDPSFVSLVASIDDPIFIVADSNYTVRLAFTNTVLTKVLREGLRGARVEPLPDDANGWGSGWILEGRFFIGRDGQPEVWIPLRDKDAQAGKRDSYVTIGLRHGAGRFECIDESACAAWGIPQAFDADFSKGLAATAG